MRRRWEPYVWVKIPCFAVGPQHNHHIIIDRQSVGTSLGCADSSLQTTLLDFALLTYCPRGPGDVQAIIRDNHVQTTTIEMSRPKGRLWPPA